MFYVPQFSLISSHFPTSLYLSTFLPPPLSLFLLALSSLTLPLILPHFLPHPSLLFFLPLYPSPCLSNAYMCHSSLSPVLSLPSSSFHQCRHLPGSITVCCRWGQWSGDCVCCAHWYINIQCGCHHINARLNSKMWGTIPSHTTVCCTDSLNVHTLSITSTTILLMCVYL